jgi:Phage integrase family
MYIRPAVFGTRPTATRMSPRAIFCSPEVVRTTRLTCSPDRPSTRWDQVDFRTAALHVRRVKKGTPSTHPILGDELRVLRRLQREQEPKSPFVFVSERGAPFTTAGFSRVVERAGVEAKLGFKAHPHMLRHACGSAGREGRPRAQRGARSPARHDYRRGIPAKSEGRCSLRGSFITRLKPQ